MHGKDVELTDTIAQHEQAKAADPIDQQPLFSYHENSFSSSVVQR
jgi:hypothetical protein